MAENFLEKLIEADLKKILFLDQFARNFHRNQMGISILAMRSQFLRHGYCCVDMNYTTNEKLLFNRTVSLKDF